MAQERLIPSYNPHIFAMRNVSENIWGLGQKNIDKYMGMASESLVPVELFDAFLRIRIDPTSEQTSDAQIWKQFALKLYRMDTILPCDCPHVVLYGITMSLLKLRNIVKAVQPYWGQRAFSYHPYAIPVCRFSEGYSGLLAVQDMYGPKKPSRPQMVEDTFKNNPGLAASVKMMSTEGRHGTRIVDSIKELEIYLKEKNTQHLPG